MRTTAKIGIGGAILAAVGAALFAGPIGAGIVAFAYGQRAGVDNTAGLPDGLHVALCGTGAPLPDPTRAGPCTLVMAGKHIFVLDAGDGGTRHLSLMGMPMGRIEAVFLTHFHSDHIDGLGPMMLLRWTGAAATSPLPIYGPPGVDHVVGGFDAAYRLDDGYRTAHHGRGIAPPSGAGGTAVTFTPPRRGSLGNVVVYERDGLRVTAFSVEHGPVDPAVGYRFDYKGRSVVISGDTAASAALVANAKGADLLVHEALQPALVGLMTKALVARHQPGIAQITRDILDYHTAPEVAAREAQQAGVRHLLFTHILPPLPFRSGYAAFLDSARREFGGTITVGEDGMMFSLPAGGTTMEFRRLPVD